MFMDDFTYKRWYAAINAAVDKLLLKGLYAMPAHSGDDWRVDSFIVVENDDMSAVDFPDSPYEHSISKNQYVFTYNESARLAHCEICLTDLDVEKVGYAVEHAVKVFDYISAILINANDSTYPVFAKRDEGFTLGFTFSTDTPQAEYNRMISTGRWKTSFAG